MRSDYGSQGDFPSRSGVEAFGQDESAHSLSSFSFFKSLHSLSPPSAPEMFPMSQYGEPLMERPFGLQEPDIFKRGPPQSQNKEEVFSIRSFSYESLSRKEEKDSKKTKMEAVSTGICFFKAKPRQNFKKKATKKATYRLEESEALSPSLSFSLNVQKTLVFKESKNETSLRLSSFPNPFDPGCSDSNEDLNQDSKQSPQKKSIPKRKTCKCQKNRCKTFYCECLNINECCSPACKCKNCKNTKSIRKRRELKRRKMDSMIEKENIDPMPIDFYNYNCSCVRSRQKSGCWIHKNTNKKTLTGLFCIESDSGEKDRPFSSLKCMLSKLHQYNHMWS